MRLYWTLLLTLISPLFVYSQDNVSPPTKPDTIFIYKEPVVVKKTVYYTDKKDNKIKNKDVWVQFSFSPLFTFNHYKPCPGWDFYLDSIKKHIHSSVGISGNINFLFFTNNFLIGGGIGYFNYKEKISLNTNGIIASTNNSYKYLNIPISFGYKVVNRKSFSVIPSGCLITGFNISNNGYTFSEELNSQITEIKNVQGYSTINWSLSLKTNFIFYAAEKWKIGVEPYYNISLICETKDLMPYTLTRSSIGINASYILVFK